MAEVASFANYKTVAPGGNAEGVYSVVETGLAGGGAPCSALQEAEDGCSAWSDVGHWGAFSGRGGNWGSGAFLFQDEKEELGFTLPFIL